jgi:hypothetical protein
VGAPDGAVGELKKMCLHLVLEIKNVGGWGVEIRKKRKNNLFPEQISVAVRPISR